MNKTARKDLTRQIRNAVRRTHHGFTLLMRAADGNKLTVTQVASAAIFHGQLMEMLTKGAGAIQVLHGPRAIKFVRLDDDVARISFSPFMTSVRQDDAFEAAVRQEAESNRQRLNALGEEVSVPVLEELADTYMTLVRVLLNRFHANIAPLL